MVSLDSIEKTRKEFHGGDFSDLKFWCDQKNQFPNLYAVAARIYSTPVLSSANERVFSTLKQFVDDKRSGVSISLIDDMIVVRTLHK